MVRYSAGIVTAYGAAKRAGYTGTYEDFCRQQAEYAESAAAVEQAKTTAVNAAATATTKAGEATTAATAAQTAKAQTEQAASQAQTDISTAKATALSGIDTAKSTAVSAVQSEGQTQTTNARAQAQAASQSAAAAQASAATAGAAKALAEAAATNAATSATNAATSATNAAQSASDAQAVLESIPEDYSDLSSDVDKLKADLADVTNHAVKSAEQLISDKRTTDKVPYKYRASASGKSDRAYDVIVGGTVCFNQLVNIQGSDISKTENGVTFTDNGDGTYTVSTDANGATAQTQLYISSGEYADTIYHVFFVCGSPSNADGDTYMLYTNTNILSNGKVYKSDVNVPRLRIIVKAGVVITTPITFRPQIFDLTIMFGTEIADHIYSLEQATAGAGVALFMTMFPNEYYPYNAGSLVSVEGLSAHVMRDADDNIIGSYPLDSTLTLRGVPILKNGKIEFDGDTYEADGTVTRRYGIVDLGTLTWSNNSDDRIDVGKFYSAKIPGIAGGAYILPKYSQYKNITLTLLISRFGSGIDKIAWTISAGSIYCIDSDYADEVEFKTAMSGVYIVYELATPTTETATPYTSPQIVNPYGTEEYISETVCPVGHITEYPDNLRAKIEGLPWDLSMIAPVETAYTATRNYTVGQLLIVDNTLYKVTANVANGGTITAGTNVVATTLSEIISALA